MALQTAVLLAGLAVAVYWDVRRRRIPNALTVSMALAGLILYTVADGYAGSLVSVKGLLVGFGLFFLPFVMGGLGGGDVKLAMAVGALTGPEAALYTVLYGALVGGVIASAILVARGRLVHTCRHLIFGAWALVIGRAWNTSNSRTQPAQSGATAESGAAGNLEDGFPYAIAIAVGALLALGLAPIGR